MKHAMIKEIIKIVNQRRGVTRAATEISHGDRKASVTIITFILSSPCTHTHRIQPYESEAELQKRKVQRSLISHGRTS